MLKLYRSFYKLTGLPFQLTPDPEFFFGSRSHNKAMAHLTYGVSQGEGIIVVTGEDGVGKSTLTASFARSLDHERYLVACLVGSHLAPDTALQNLADRLDIVHQGLEKDVLVARIRGFLESVHGARQHVLVVVDEAQDLAVPFLDDLRLISDIKFGNDAPVQLVLLGSEGLRRRLNEDPGLAALEQRVIASYHLRPLADPEETGAYIRHRLAHVGWQGDPSFSDEAVETIHHFCSGFPRRVNQLCARLLLHGCLESLHDIGQDVVTKVIAELVVDTEPQEEAEEMSPAGPHESVSLRTMAPEPDEGPAEEMPVEKAFGGDEEPRMAFDRRTIIETGAEQAPVRAPQEPVIEAQVRPEVTPEPERQEPASAPEPTLPSTAGPGDQPLVDAIVAELGMVDPALPGLLAAELLGRPACRADLAQGGDARRLGLGPLTATMLYRAALRELQAIDPPMVRLALARVTGSALPSPVVPPEPENAAVGGEVLDRLEALEKRIRANEKLLAKTLKALKKLK